MSALAPRSAAAWALALSLGVAAAAAAGRAHAQAAPTAPATPAAPAAPERSQADRERAHALMDDGDAKVEQGDLAGALAAYEAAHALMGVPTTGIEVARTLDRLGRLRDALAAARAVAAIAAAPGEPKPFTDAREQARALAADLEARVPTLAVTVKVAQPGARAQVALDGKPLAPEDLQAPLALDPGRYKVSATADAHTPTSVEITLKERDRAQVALALARVVVVASPPPPPPAPPPPPRPALSPFVPVGFTAAGVGAVAGAITGALAISAANQANNLCPAGLCPSPGARDTAQARYDEADALAVASDVSFGLAVVGAALGIYGVVVTTREPPAPPASGQKAARRAAPFPAPAVVVGPGGATLRVSF